MCGFVLSDALNYTEIICCIKIISYTLFKHKHLHICIFKAVGSKVVSDKLG